MKGRQPPLPWVGGYEGLALAIVARAALDYCGPNRKHRRDAFEFFTGDWYQLIVECLGLPSDVLPVLVDDADGFGR